MQGSDGPKGDKGDKGLGLYAPAIRHHTVKAVANVTGNKSLSCTFFGNPIPSITWKYSIEDISVVNTVSYEKSETTSILTLNNLNWNDTGNVTCVAESILGREEKVGFVDVHGMFVIFLLV